MGETNNKQVNFKDIILGKNQCYENNKDLRCQPYGDYEKTQPRQVQAHSKLYGLPSIGYE